MDDHPGGDEVLLSATGNILIHYFYPTCLLYFGSTSANHIKLETSLLILLNFTGKDATNDFEDVGHSDTAREMMEKYCIGEIDAATVPLKRTYIPPHQPYNPDKTPEFLIKILQFLVPLAILGLAFAVRYYTKEK